MSGLLRRMLLATRTAAGELRRAPVVSAVLIGLLAVLVAMAATVAGPVNYAITVASFGSPMSPYTLTLTLSAAVLTFLVIRFAVAAVARRRVRTGVLLALNGGRRSDARMVQ